MRSFRGITPIIASAWVTTCSIVLPAFAGKPTVTECPAQELRVDLDYQLTIQDQDDLGICYASSAATMLQALDPAHRPVSALELSLQTALTSDSFGTQSDFVVSRDAVVDGKTVKKHKAFNESGNACSAFLKAMEIGACPKELSLLENSDRSIYDEAVERAEREAAARKTQGSQSASASGGKSPFSAGGYVARGMQFGKDLGDTGAKGQINPVEFQAEVLYQVGLMLDALKKGKVENSKVQEYLKTKAPLLLKLYRENSSSESLEKTATSALLSLANTNSCQKSILDKEIIELAKVMKKVSADSEFSEVLRKLKNPGADVLLGAITPKCVDSENRIRYSKSYNCDPVLRPASVKEYSGVILDSLSKSKPIFLNMCSAILKHPTQISDSNAFWKCKELGGDSHFVTIIGARKGPGGACQFLIQNSWGTDCAAHLKDCKDGRSWIDDSTLYPVSKSFNVVTDKPKDTPAKVGSQQGSGQ